MQRHKQKLGPMKMQVSDIIVAIIRLRLSTCGPSSYPPKATDSPRFIGFYDSLRCFLQMHLSRQEVQLLRDDAKTFRRFHDQSNHVVEVITSILPSSQNLTNFTHLSNSSHQRLLLELGHISHRHLHSRLLPYPLAPITTTNFMHSVVIEPCVTASRDFIRGSTGHAPAPSCSVSLQVCNMSDPVKNPLLFPETDTDNLPQWRFVFLD